MKPFMGPMMKPMMKPFVGPFVVKSLLKLLPCYFQCLEVVLLEQLHVLCFCMVTGLWHDISTTAWHLEVKVFEFGGEATPILAPRIVKVPCKRIAHVLILSATSAPCSMESHNIR